MTIAYVSDAIYPYNKGGKEKRLFELSTRLAAMGHDVHIYCMKWWDGPKDRIENGVHLHAISRLYPMYKGDRRSIKEGIFFGAAVLKMINKRFDVIDVDHMPFFPIFSGWLVCKLRGKKLHGTWHEALSIADWTSYMGKAGYVAAGIERLSVRLPHTITVSSGHTLQLIKSTLKRSKRLYLVPPGIDLNLIKTVRPTANKYDVLFVGRLVKDKNAALLIDAIANVVKTKKSITCALIGTGIENTNLKNQILKLKLEKNVHLLGVLPEAKDIYAYMKAAKVFAFPSLREGFGIVVLESIACNTPVVTINTPANASQRLVEHNITGAVTEPSPALFAKQLITWLSKDTRSMNISQEAQKYDWGKLASTQAKVYAS